MRPLLQGVALWVVVASVSLAAIYFRVISISRSAFEFSCGARREGFGAGEDEAMKGTGIPAGSGPATVTGENQRPRDRFRMRTKRRAPRAS